MPRGFGFPGIALVVGGELLNHARKAFSPLARVSQVREEPVAKVRNARHAFRRFGREGAEQGFLAVFGNVRQEARGHDDPLVYALERVGGGARAEWRRGAEGFIEHGGEREHVAALIYRVAA